MADNGSPDPIFDTDQDFTCFLTTLPAHLKVGNGESNGESNQVIEIIKTEIHDRVVEMLEILSTWMKRELLFEKLGLSNQTKNRSKYLDPLIKIGWVEKQYPEINNRNQVYQIITSGKRILSLINKH